MHLKLSDMKMREGKTYDEFLTRVGLLAMEYCEEFECDHNSIPSEAVVVEELTKDYYHGHLGIRDTSKNFTHIILEAKNMNGAMAKMNIDDIKDVINRLQILHSRMT